MRKAEERLAGADLTFEMPVLPDFSVLLQFWDGDEEFPPKILLLWDKVSLSYLHFETTYYLQGSSEGYTADNRLNTLQPILGEDIWNRINMSLRTF